MATVPAVRVPSHDRVTLAPQQIRAAALPRRYQVETAWKHSQNRVARAAIAGFGLALGRDLYRVTKRVAALVLLLAAVFLWAILPFLSGRLLTRGRGWADYALGILLLPPGLLTCGVMAAALRSGRGVDQFSTSSDLAALSTLAGILYAVFAIAGIFVGLRDRDLQEAALTVAEHNERFLAEHGIRETGGRDVTHFDGDGIALRFIEAHHDRLLFMVVGRRGRRASIHLDESGRMHRYAGAA